MLVDHTKTSSTVDLSTGTVIANDEIAPIRMADQPDDNYRAVVIPQTVAAGKQLLSITLDGQTYSHKLTTDMNYLSGKLHNFTMTVNKSEATGDYEISVTDDGITPWVNDESSHQFTAMAFVTVHCPEPGKLKESIITSGYDPATVQNLKVTGIMTLEDLRFLNEMTALHHLNLKDVKMKGRYINEDDYFWDDDITFWGITPPLYSLVLPKSLKRVGYLRIESLMYSTLEIPEGVTYIGLGALGNLDYNGVELILPSTLDTISLEAFQGCKYKCELKLTDNIKYIGRVSDDKLKELYGAAKVFALPSIGEGVGLVALDAAVYGCDIVVTSIGGPKEYYDGLAFEVDPYSVNSIGKAVMSAMSATDRQPRLMRHVIDCYSLAKCMHKLADSYATSSITD